MTTIANFTQLVNLCLEAASAKYGTLPKVAIRYDLRGRAAGQAGHRGGAFFLRFNKEAIQKNWEEMVNETIGHEVAHIVAYAKPELGAKGHNGQWRTIAQALGCHGARCHSMGLTPTRRVTRFRYVTDRGLELLVGPKHHKLIQQYGKAAGIRVKRTGEYLDRHHYTSGATMKMAA